jgi:hypothetical protein
LAKHGLVQLAATPEPKRAWLISRTIDVGWRQT